MVKICSFHYILFLWLWQVLKKEPKRIYWITYNIKTARRDIGQL